MSFPPANVVHVDDGDSLNGFRRGDRVIIETGATGTLHFIRAIISRFKLDGGSGKVMAVVFFDPLNQLRPDYNADGYIFNLDQLRHEPVVDRIARLA